MLTEWIKNQTPVHTRDIQMATFPHPEDGILVHGSLKDTGHIRMFDVTGELKEPGIIHHISLTLWVRPNPLRIADAEAEMIRVPLTQCRSTLDTLENIKGLPVASGFSRAVRSILGGPSGCTHLAQLALAMGQEIIHGWLVQKRSTRSPLPESVEHLAELPFLLDSCRMWTRTGPKMKNLENAISARR